MTDTLALIPARGGSKGVPRKNVRDLAGRPLIAYTIDAAREASSVDRTVVSTDDEQIRDAALDCGAEVPFLRPAELATDEAPTEPVIEHALRYLTETEDDEFDAVVLLQPTSPLRDSDDVDSAVEQYESADVSSLVAVSEDHSNRWRKTETGAERVNYTESVKRRQEKTPEYVETGAIYITDVESFLETGSIRAGDTSLYVMDERRSVDIDTEFDLWLAEQILVKLSHVHD